MEAKIKPIGEDAPKKKRHIMRWIFNILCLLVISFLFLVGVWTRTLLWVWLIVPIVLWIAAFKRKIAGLLALGFLACMAGIIIWLFLPDSGNWRPYNFDYELKDLEAKRAVTDAENATIAYQKIITRLDVNNAPPFYNDSKHNESNEPSTHIFWKGGDHPETAAFVDARANLIAEAMTASIMEKCAFPIWTNPMDMPMDTLSGMRKMAYLVVSAANRDMGEGRIDEAAEKYNCLIQMGQQLKRQPMFIHLLVGVAIEALAERRLQSAIVTADLIQTQLDNIRQIIPTTTDNWPELYSTIFKYEKMLGKNMFGIMLYEINDDGTVRFRRDPMPFPKELRQSLPPTTTLLRKLTKLIAIGSWFAYPHNPCELSRMYDEEFEQAKTLYDANRTENETKLDFKFYLQCLKNPQRGLILWMAKIAEPAGARVHEIYLRTIAYRRTMHILIALREYKDANGRWPDNLDQIKDKVPAEAMADPFTGGSFIYEAKGDKFLLYSVGANKIDEKCERWPKTDSLDIKTVSKELKELDDILIWPQKFEQAKEFFDANAPAAK
jgi:hypothetical protein